MRERLKKRNGDIDPAKENAHQQQVELLKHQNKISEERIAYLKEMERKLNSGYFRLAQSGG